MKTIITLVIIGSIGSLLLQGQSQRAVDFDDRSGMLSAPTGQYVDGNGGLYDVSTKGPVALSVRSDNGDLCLRFWREKGPVGEDRIARLRGQSCSNKTFGDVPWSATYSYDEPNQINLIPPKQEENPAKAELRLIFKGAAK